MNMTKDTYHRKQCHKDWCHRRQCHRRLVPQKTMSQKTDATENRSHRWCDRRLVPPKTMSQKIAATEKRCHKTQSTFITRQCCVGSFNFCTTLLVLLLSARMRNPLNNLQCSAYRVEQFNYSRTGNLSEATKITPTFTLERKSRDSSLQGTHISTNAVPIIGQIPKCNPNVCTQLKDKPTYGVAMLKHVCQLNK